MKGKFETLGKIWIKKNCGVYFEGKKEVRECKLREKEIEIEINV